MENHGYIRKPKDISHINTNEVGELLWWSYQFSISPEKLLSIQQEAGNNIEAVKKWIREHHTEGKKAKGDNSKNYG